MIAAIAIPLYFLIGLLVGRYTAQRRRRLDNWGYQGDGKPDEDDYLACAGAILMWPAAVAMYVVTAEPKPKKLDRLKAEIADLERELSIG